jgi:hypothetical protein
MHRYRLYVADIGLPGARLAKSAKTRQLAAQHYSIEVTPIVTSERTLPILLIEIAMSGRAGRYQGRGGWGGHGAPNVRGGRGRGNYYSSTGAAVKHKGLCAALTSHVFEYGQKGAAEQMRATWEKIVHHVGAIYGYDISNELQNKKTVVIPKPEHTKDVMNKHTQRITRHNTQEQRLVRARLVQKRALEAAVMANDIDAPMTLAILENEIEEARYQATIDLPITLDETEKTKNSNAWRTYRERNSRLETQRGQAFSMIRGQCMQVLLDKMKHDPDWMPASKSYDPLTLLRLIEKTILAQTEDQYPYATVYEQECALHSFQQNALTNEQWYERFNTKIDVGSAIGVTRQHQILLDHVAAENGGTVKLEQLTPSEQDEVRAKAEERYLSFVFLRQSGKQHNELKVDLQNDFTTGDDRYPKNRQSTLHLLDKCSKSTIVTTTPTSEGTALAQRGDGNANKTVSDKDKKHWKDKKCYHCGKTGHPSTHCQHKSTSGGSGSKKDDDDKSRSSKSSKTTTAGSTSQLKK